MNHGTKDKHLLLIRLSAMGDVAMTAPVVAALRNEYPNLRITVLTRGFFTPFFRDISGIDFIVPDFDGLHKGIAGLLKLADQIKDLGVTHVADLHDVLRTKVIRTSLRVRGIKIASINKGRSEKRALTRKFRKYKVQLKPTVERYRDVFVRLGFCFNLPHAVGSDPVNLDPEMFSWTGKKEGAWIGFAPFAKHKGKVYPAVLADRLAGLLAGQGAKVFIFGGGPYEQEFAEHLQNNYQGLVSAIGKTNLGGELDLISNLDVMVSMDSSAMHMASLVGVPVVSVWGATHPFAGFYGYGQNENNAVQLDMECRPCSVYGKKPCMYGDYRCLEKIPPEEIAGLVRKILDDK